MLFSSSKQLVRCFVKPGRNQHVRVGMRQREIDWHHTHRLGLADMAVTDLWETASDTV